MKRLEVRFRPEALADLSAIFIHVQELGGNYETARAFVLRIRERCERIGDAPHGGRARDDLEKGLRTVPFERRAIIAYKVEVGCVRVANIFYGGRNYEAVYRNRPPEDASP